MKIKLTDQKAIDKRKKLNKEYDQAVRNHDHAKISQLAHQLAEPPKNRNNP